MFKTTLLQTRCNENDKDARRNANKTRDTSRVTKSEFSIGFKDRGSMLIGYRLSPRGVFSSAVLADYLGQEKFGSDLGGGVTGTFTRGEPPQEGGFHNTNFWGSPPLRFQGLHTFKSIPYIWFYVNSQSATPFASPLVSACACKFGVRNATGQRSTERRGTIRKRRYERANWRSVTASAMSRVGDCTPATPSFFPENPYIGTMVHEVMKWQHGVSRGREWGNQKDYRMKQYIGIYVGQCISNNIATLVHKTGLNSPVFVVERSGNKSLDKLVEADLDPTRKESTRLERKRAKREQRKKERTSSRETERRRKNDQKEQVIYEWRDSEYLYPVTLFVTDRIREGKQRSVLETMMNGYGFLYICARSKKKCQSSFLLAKGSTGSGPRQVPKVAREEEKRRIRSHFFLPPDNKRVMLASPEDWPTSASGAVRLAEALDDRSSPRGLGPSVVLTNRERGVALRKVKVPPSPRMSVSETMKSER
ncbi:hypothetical protein EAG_00853 [Camponotus floridanus]|uniref:Uncharacterized protein n=1 Tax=Camponotus floridanus TaxID=104421 RepID=E2AQ89_CAMFO|nr:hypothetical protein EAG_00853 [Camponotus floridanus]